MRLVRTYARNVRSEARWSRATLPEFSNVSAGFSFLASSRNFFRLSSVVTSAPDARSEVCSWLSSAVRMVSAACDLNVDTLA